MISRPATPGGTCRTPAFRSSRGSTSRDASASAARSTSACPEEGSSCVAVPDSRSCRRCSRLDSPFLRSWSSRRRRDCRAAPDPLRQQPDASTRSAPRVVAALLVDRRRSGDVEMRPRHLSDEVLQEERRVDRAAEAASGVLQIGDRALDQLFHLRGKRHPPEGRSEEHTSELQSRLHLVCRLLLEKKKRKVVTAHS